MEKFETELKLPDWQIEPDDEAIFADPGNYSLVDENGNLVEPNNDGPKDGGPGDSMVDEKGGLITLPPAANDDPPAQPASKKGGLR